MRLLTRLLFVPVLLTGAACAGPDTPPPDLSASPSSSTETPSQAAAQTPGADTPAPQATPTAAAPVTTTPAPPGRRECKAADLEVTVVPGSGAGMSHVGVNLRFTNRSTRACQLQGSPGVSFVTGADGRQLGEPADRAPKSSGKVVVLEPKRSADAELLITSTGPYPREECRPERAAGLRIYAPNDTAAMFTPYDQETCSAPGKVMLRVQTIGG